MTIITANALGRALYAPILDDPANQANTARFMFFSSSADTFFPDWDQGADEIVATLRSYAVLRPHDKGLTDLIGELVTRSDEFRMRWARHNVRFRRLGIKRIHHPLVGDLELDYEAMDLPANPDWCLFAHIAKPGSPTEERLTLLGSLAVTE
jgi:hypothetical protein